MNFSNSFTDSFCKISDNYGVIYVKIFLIYRPPIGRPSRPKLSLDPMPISYMTMSCN